MPSPSDQSAAELEQFELDMQGYSEQASVAVEASKVARVAAEREREERVTSASKVVDIVERAKQIANDVQFADIKRVKMGDLLIASPKPTDRNKRQVLDALFQGAENRPHFCTYKGRIVDMDQNPIDEFYPGRKFHDAFDAVGLRELKESDVIDAVRRWALEHRQNDLALRVERMIPEWDGKERCATALIDMFESFSTPLHRAFGLYFWCSILMRVTRPGSEAQCSLVLCGAQNAGKSHFSKMLARIITGDPDADAVQLDLDGDRLSFLRDITGHSPIASLGEMSGYMRADLNKLKSFLSKSSDVMHQKFEGTHSQLRGWVAIGDSNEYTLFRDPTGNRRFMPWLCGAMLDPEGNPAWREDFRANFDGFEENFWQLMAEARAWVEANGVDGYNAMARDVSGQVFLFSQSEMKAGRGVVKDDSVLPFVPAALDSAPCREILSRKGKSTDRGYVFYDRVDLVSAIKLAAGDIDPTREKRFLKDLEKACGMLGDGVPAKRDCGKVPGFAFYSHPTKESLLAAIGVTGEADKVKMISGTPQQVSGF